MRCKATITTTRNGKARAKSRQKRERQSKKIGIKWQYHDDDSGAPHHQANNIIIYESIQLFHLMYINRVYARTHTCTSPPLYEHYSLCIWILQIPTFRIQCGTQTHAHKRTHTHTYTQMLLLGLCCANVNNKQSVCDNDRIRQDEESERSGKDIFECCSSLCDFQAQWRRTIVKYINKCAIIFFKNQQQ